MVTCPLSSTSRAKTWSLSHETISWLDVVIGLGSLLPLPWSSRLAKDFTPDSHNNLTLVSSATDLQGCQVEQLEILKKTRTLVKKWKRAIFFPSSHKSNFFQLIWKIQNLVFFLEEGEHWSNLRALPPIPSGELITKNSLNSAATLEGRMGVRYYQDACTKGWLNKIRKNPAGSATIL